MRSVAGQEGELQGRQTMDVVDARPESSKMIAMVKRWHLGVDCPPRVVGVGAIEAPLFGAENGA